MDSSSSARLETVEKSRKVFYVKNNNITLYEIKRRVAKKQNAPINMFKVRALWFSNGENDFDIDEDKYLSQYSGEDRTVLTVHVRQLKSPRTNQKKIINDWNGYTQNSKGIKE